MKPVSVVAVDMSASEGRVVVGTYDGSRLGFDTVHRFPVGFERYGGHIYWAYGGLFEEILTGLRRARAAHPGLASCGIDFWGCDHALVGGDGRLLHPIYSYRDARTGRILSGLKPAQLEQLYAWTGIPPVLYNTTLQLAETLHAAPGLLGCVRHCLFLADYTNFLLTGKVANEISALSTGQLLRIEGADVSAETLEFFGIPGRWFERPQTAGRVLGAINGGEDLNGLPVVLVPGHDTACAFEALPSFGESAFLMTGSTWILTGYRGTAPYRDTDGCYLGISNERCGNGGYHPTRILLGLWLVRKILDSFNAGGDDAAQRDEIERAVAALPRCREVLSPFDNVLFSPRDMRKAVDEYLRQRKRDAPASLPEYLRLVYDSLAHSIAASARVLRHTLETPFDHVVAGGPVARNALLCQSVADATGKTVYALDFEAAAAGNILYQLVALNALPDVHEGRAVLARSIGPRTYVPVPGSHPDFVI